jgi:hypothetical protein
MRTSKAPDTPRSPKFSALFANGVLGVSGALAVCGFAGLLFLNLIEKTQ